jgi:prephenate dehydratase
MRVAFQGERGAYSEEALRSHFGDTDVMPCPDLHAVFEAVSSSRAEAGLVPVENSEAGTIAETYDLLQAFTLHVTAEVELRVRHCLLALDGQPMEGIERVHSHPQALAQCDAFTRAHGWKAVAEYDTAGSAKLVAERRMERAAAIASRVAARVYGLTILAEGIETNPSNTTRFLAIGREPADRADPSKTSLVFGVANRPGSLYRALGAFASRGLNATKLESRPTRKVPWEYVFYLDFEGHPDDPEVSAAIGELKHVSGFVRILGAYPAAGRSQAR